MVGHFFDSSALVKRYHPELGSATVNRIFETGNRILISRLSGTELVSASAIKVRTGATTREHAAGFLNRYSGDVADGKLQVTPVSQSDYVTAERLLEDYAHDLRLRTLDALQLAVALNLRSQGLIDHFVASDKTLCQVAKHEGFFVINPELTD